MCSIKVRHQLYPRWRTTIRLFESIDSRSWNNHMTRRPPAKELIVWRLLDGRAGHENQVLGLSEAIRRLQPTRCCDIRIDQRLRGIRSLLPGRLSIAESLPRPDLLIAAGHGTHIPLLRLQRQFGGRSIVIMKPSLPMTLFDTCIIPSHDEVKRPANNVIVTEGTVNRIRPLDRRSTDCGMILVGGPSRHFHWSNELILNQIRAVVESSTLPHVIATSQRTPLSFRSALLESGFDIPVREASEFDADWIASTLSHSESVWVTCDSMSMIFEAITSSAGVGLLELPAASPGRLFRSIERLAQRGLVTRWSEWSKGAPLQSQANFCESDRSAEILLHRLGIADSAFHRTSARISNPRQPHPSSR
jgi:mitochondrial fission protein ELM1